jgi:hypothetical protein
MSCPLGPSAPGVQGGHLGGRGLAGRYSSQAGPPPQPPYSAFSCTASPLGASRSGRRVLQLPRTDHVAAVWPNVPHCLSCRGEGHQARSPETGGPSQRPKHPRSWSSTPRVGGVMIAEPTTRPWSAGSDTPPGLSGTLMPDSSPPVHILSSPPSSP